MHKQYQNKLCTSTLLNRICRLLGFKLNCRENQFEWDIFGTFLCCELKILELNKNMWEWMKSLERKNRRRVKNKKKNFWAILHSCRENSLFWWIKLIESKMKYFSCQTKNHFRIFCLPTTKCERKSKIRK